MVKESFLAVGKASMPILRRTIHRLSNARTPESDKGWYYVDESGQIRGNFTAESMRAWYEQGHLLPTLMVRHGISENFNRIDELWKLGVDSPFVEDELDNDLLYLQSLFMRFQNALA